MYSAKMLSIGEAKKMLVKQGKEYVTMHELESKLQKAGYKLDWHVKCTPPVKGSESKIRYRCKSYSIIEVSNGTSPFDYYYRGERKGNFGELQRIRANCFSEDGYSIVEF